MTLTGLFSVILSPKHDELVPKGSTVQWTKFAQCHSAGSEMQPEKAALDGKVAET